MHLIDLDVGMMGTSAVVGTTLPNAIGYAYAQMIDNSPIATLCFIGDGATEEGSFYEAINFAVLHKLPIVIVCENNGWAIHSPLHQRQANSRIFEKVAGFGCQTVAVDGYDLAQLHTVAQESVAKVRSGQGPVFVECSTYRDVQHVGPSEDFALGYRDEAEAERWRQRDPILQLQSQLSVADCARLEASIRAEIDQAVQFAEHSEFPAPDALFNDVFG